MTKDGAFQLARSRADQRIAVGPVVAVAGEQPHQSWTTERDIACWLATRYSPVMPFASPTLPGWDRAWGGLLQA